jgi:hypothetical protein
VSYYIAVSIPTLPITILYPEEDGSNWAIFATCFRGVWKAISGEPDPIKDVAHTHNDRTEPDIQSRQPGDPNVNTPKGVAHAELGSMPGEEVDLDAPAHLGSAGPEALMDEEEDRLLKVEEDGAARKAVSVEGDIGPHVELQKPGVSYLATQENAGSLTLSSPPPITQEAASMQRLPAVNIGTPKTPERDRGTDLDPPLHDTPPPDEAVEHPNHQSLEQIRAPTKVGGPLESLRGEQT